MKILVVDDERAFGSLLAKTLKQLGHEPVVALHPHDALARLGETSVDAVIADIDMPAMNGVELAKVIREADSEMPIAFCTGSEPEVGVLMEAETIGKVLPKVWTVTDVRGVVDSLGHAQRRRGSSPPPMAPPRRRRRTSDQPTTGGVVRRARQRVKLSCRSWGRVARLAGDSQAGRGTVTMRGNYPMRPGEIINVALYLPDEITLSIESVVSRIDRDPDTGEKTFYIELKGLDRKTADAMLRLCEERA